MVLQTRSLGTASTRPVSEHDSHFLSTRSVSPQSFLSEVTPSTLREVHGLSKEHTDLNYRIQALAIKTSTNSLFLVLLSLHGLFFKPACKYNTSLRTVSELLPEYTVSHSRGFKCPSWSSSVTTVRPKSQSVITVCFHVSKSLLCCVPPTVRDHVSAYEEQVIINL
jgi:hypothetical protein